MESTRECSARSRGHAENNRVLGDNRVIGEAISAHDTAPAAVTIKPHNRTIALDQGRARRPSRGGAHSSGIPDPRHQCVLIRPRHAPEPLRIRIGPGLRTYLRILN